MADEQTVANEQSSWWAATAGDDALLPPLAVDDPVDWADAIRWPDSAEPQPAPAAVAPPPGEGTPPPVEDAGPDEVPLDAGGADDPFTSDLVDPLLPVPVAEQDDAEFPLELLPASIWAPEAVDLPDIGLAGTELEETGFVPATDEAEPTFYAQADRPAAPYRSGRFEALQAKPVAIALAALVVAAVIGVLFSARNRADVSPTASQGPGNGDIAVQAPPRTVVIGTTTTVLGSPTPNLAINDLLPPGAQPVPDAGTAPAPGPAPAPAGGAPAGPRAGAPAPTSPPRASTSPAPAGQSGAGSGGGGSPAPAAADPAPAPTPPPADPTPAPVQPEPTPPRTRPTAPPPEVSVPVITIPTVDATPGATPTTRPKSSVPSVPSVPAFGSGINF